VHAASILAINAPDAGKMRKLSGARSVHVALRTVIIIVQTVK